MTIPFWGDEPTVLFNKQYLFEWWPTPNMCYERKLNAVSRLVVVLSLLGYVMSHSKTILLVGIFTLLSVYLLSKFRENKRAQNLKWKEGFITGGDEIHPESNTNDASPDKKKKNGNGKSSSVPLDTLLADEFQQGTKKNPFSNVLPTHIHDEPERKSAPPAFHPEVEKDITKNVKRAVQMMNPTIKNTNKKLFGDLWDKFQLDTSLRGFYSTPNTRVANDQGAYAEFLYGNMPSAKESTPDGNIQRYKNSHRYTLY